MISRAKQKLGNYNDVSLILKSSKDSGKNIRKVKMTAPLDFEGPMLLLPKSDFDKSVYIIPLVFKNHFHDTLM